MVKVRNMDVLAAVFAVAIALFVVCFDSTKAEPSKIRIVAGNITSGSHQSYDNGEGIRIFKGLRPDIVLIQEFNYGTNSQTDIADFVSSTFGSNFHYYREPALSGGYIPNGIISKYPILESGVWVDSNVGNRKFAYARIDVPGNKDLWAVSVHLLNGSSSRRKAEGKELASYIRQHVPDTDYLVVGGNFNTGSAGEAVFQELDPLLELTPRPADQQGDPDTNKNRGKPYDWVLPDDDLSSLGVPVVIGSNSFASGLVFDSRRYTPLSDVPPVLKEDSGIDGMQHMAVVKDFALP